MYYEMSVTFTGFLLCSLCLHFECVPFSIGWEQTNVASDWLRNLNSANFSNSLKQKIAKLELMNVPRFPSFPR